MDAMMDPATMDQSSSAAPVPAASAGIKICMNCYPDRTFSVYKEPLPAEEASGQEPGETGHEETGEGEQKYDNEEDALKAFYREMQDFEGSGKDAEQGMAEGFGTPAEAGETKGGYGS